jgi:hypothetical protein
MNKPDTPPFLTRLSLNIDADGRAIRRAYARELKLIDQESDAAGFQSLREQYELALQWFEYQEWERVHGSDDDDDESAEPELATPAPAVSLVKAASPAVDPSAPSHLATIVYERLIDACRDLAAKADGGTLPEWEQTIRTHLGNDELFNIAARALFEQFIVDWLANGWAPGKEKLFAAATDVFLWGDDRRRLQQFGYAGMVVNLAIDERVIFLRQDQADIETYRNIIARVREPGTPTGKQLKYDMPYLEQMLERFPHLMSLSVSDAAITHWREEFASHGGVIVRPRPQAAEPESSDGGGSFPWGIFVVILIGAGRMCSSSSAPPALPPGTLYEQVPSVATDAPPVVHLTDADVHFVLPKTTLPGTYTVRQEVQYDAQGNPVTLTDRQRSPYPEFDDAVRRAILRTGPYPQYAGRAVTFVYTATVQ